jgi:predicted RNA binding protein YcfA (HicA-like mRNA interferase family)
VNGREIIGALNRAGFVRSHQVGSHVILKHSVTNRTLAVPDHGGKDLRSGTVRKILRNAGLTVEEFIALL